MEWKNSRRIENIRSKWNDGWKCNLQDKNVKISQIQQHATTVNGRIERDRKISIYIYIFPSE